MFYDEGNNRGLISLASVIVIILASLLVVGAIIIDVQTSSAQLDKMAKIQQEMLLAEQEVKAENLKENQEHQMENKAEQEEKKAEENKVEDKKQNTAKVEDKKENKEEAKQKEQTKVQEQKASQNTTQKATQDQSENAKQNDANKQKEAQAQTQNQTPSQNQNQTEAITPKAPEKPATPDPATQTPGKIFLTFDDGPSDSTTARLLDILKKHNVKATFFVTGRGSDALIKREFDEGHSIGLHTYSHVYKSIYASEEAFFEDLNKIEQRVFNITGKHSKLTRFPGGASNTVSKFNPGIMTRLAKQVKEKGYKYWDWNVSSGDAGDTKDPNKIFENVTTQVSRSRRNVVLMHDIHSYTVDSIERIIVWAKENNYQFYRIEESMDPIQHRIAN